MTRQDIIWAVGAFAAGLLTFAGMTWQTWIGPALKAQRELASWRAGIASTLESLSSSVSASADAQDEMAAKQEERHREFFGRLDKIDGLLARVEVHVERNRERIRDIDAKAERNRESIRVLNGGRRGP